MIQMRLVMPTIPTVAQLGLTAKIRERFQHEAGTLILDAIRSLLGTDTIYRLQPEYAARKSSNPRFVRFAGKSPSQPLILSGQGIFNALTVIPNSNGFTVQVDDSEGLSPKGFDYAEKLEEITDYLGKGLDLVEDQLAELLGGIISEEMLL